MSSAATVKALRYHGNQDLRVEQIPAPTRPLKLGEVRLAPAWAGICGTDVSEYVAGPTIMSTPTHPHPLSGETLPLVLGHEFSATVTEVHPSVTNVKVGSRVAIEPYNTDGTCERCLAGVPHHCDQLYLYGAHASGGMVESLILPSKTCFELPDSVSLEFGALVEPLSVAWSGILLSKIKPGDTALVIGTGAIGLAVVACLKARGINRIAVSGRSEGRNKIVEEWNVEAVLNSTKDDIAAKTKELFDGRGVHVVFDTASTQSSVDVGLASLRKSGTFYTFGFYHDKVSIDFNQLVLQSITVIGDLIYSVGVYSDVISAIADGRLSKDILQSMITTRVSLDDALVKGMMELVNNKAAHIKILVEVNPVAANL